MNAFSADAECTTKFLVTAKNQMYGVQLRIFPSVGGIIEDWSTYQERQIRDYYLSPECGESYNKCTPLLVILTNTLTLSVEQIISIVILPLSQAFGLLLIDSTGLINKIHILDLSDHDCSPTSVYHIKNSYYTVCLNSETNIVRLLELHLNTTHIDNSYVSNLEHPHLSSVHNMTNSIYVDLQSQSGSLIYFATGYEIFYFEPLDYLFGELYIDNGLEENDCFATAIDYIGGWEMIVYCDNDQAVYIDLNREFIFETIDFAKDGRPYVCPNPDVYLAVFAEASYVQYAFRSTKQTKNFEIFSDEFDNGICVGSMDTTLFVFTDRERGTQLLNASGSSIRSLSDTTCTNYPCQPLVILEDQYLAIREKRGINWYISLFDIHDNFSLVLEAKHTSADLMAIAGSQTSNCTQSFKIFSSQTTFQPLPTMIPTFNIHHQSHSDTSLILSVSATVGCAIIAIIVVIIVVVIIFGLIFFKRKRKSSHSLPVYVASQPIAFEQRRHIHSQMVPGTSIEGIYMHRITVCCICNVEFLHVHRN